MDNEREREPFRVHDAPNHLKIESVWMIISVDDNGHEGVAAASMPNGMMAPLIAADELRLPYIIERAGHLASLVKYKKFKLIKLTTREDVRYI